MNSLRCSFFRQAADNTPRPWEGTWPQLREVLERTNAPRPGTSGDEAKKSLPAISATRFKDGTRRARENALDMGLVIFDFDNAREEATGEYWPDPRTGEPTKRPKLRKVMIDEPVGFDEVQEALWDAGVDSYTWTTWSNRPDWPKFRVVVPLAHAVPAELWVAATEWTLKRLGFDPFRRGLDLPVLRDTARLNFLPGAPYPASIRRGALAPGFAVAGGDPGRTQSRASGGGTLVPVLPRGRPPGRLQGSWPGGAVLCPWHRDRPGTQSWGREQVAVSLSLGLRAFPWDRR